MASQIKQQYAFRAQKSLGLVNGTPDYIPLPNFVSPDVAARTYNYSTDGRLYAYALPTAVRIFQAESGDLLQELPLPNIVELAFSPRGTYISTWERPVRLEDGAQHKNLRVFSVSTGEELASFTQKSQEGWNLQYTISESHAVRLVGSEVQVYRPAEWSKGIVDKLKVENASMVVLSPGLNPSIAVFVAEKKGAPASVKIYGLLSLGGAPTCQKTFFKADRAQIKWNTLGTQVLVLTHTDVDNSNKSYYGETGLYLLSAAGNFDCRVILDREGPIHDFNWSPNSKEFAVVYGFMPAKTMLFDQRVRTLHDFGTAPQNFILFNPQGRFILIAGFGNLAGKIDLYDRRNLTKITTIDASNTTHCEWSPDGRFLLTATLSPRLRVDNGIKIWHCTGQLMHVHLVEELYQASWRPTPVELVPPLPNQGLPQCPVPSESVKNMAAVAKPTPTKPQGAYRPPGARGLATPSIYKREDEGGYTRTPNRSGASSPARPYSRSPAPSAHQHHGQNGREGGGSRRHVPGSGGPGPAQGRGDGDDRKGNRKRKGKKEGEGSVDIKAAANGKDSNNGVVAAVGAGADGESQAPSSEGAGGVPPTPDGSLDPIAKKARNLNKKLKAIEELKEKAKRGEKLEATQVKKIEGEAEIRKELANLGINNA